MPDTSKWPLDDEQRAAVEAIEPAVAVLAGPGSGKTRTLSYRARYLLEDDRETGALLLTFTNKAAAEMKSRALGTGALASRRVQASTFHGFGARMLRNHGDLVGIGGEFDFLDEDSQKELAAEAAQEAGVRQRLGRWSYTRLRREEADPETAAFGEVFESAKRDLDVVDYDDLVVYTADLFESTPDAVAAYAEKYPHLLLTSFRTRTRRSSPSSVRWRWR
jgi:DNA helicase-2/ATP-dependent DNA helicase PcrA